MDSENGEKPLSSWLFVYLILRRLSRKVFQGTDIQFFTLCKDFLLIANDLHHLSWVRYETVNCFGSVPVMLQILPVPAFNDNYIWLLVSNELKQAFAVDPGDAEAVELALKNRGLELGGILVTHHHHDHTGGIANLTKDRNIPVYGPDNPNISSINQTLKAEDNIDVLGVSFSILATPGHTLDHIAYFSDQTETPALFCGDTLFAAGCGRLFEGTPEQMQQSLAQLAALRENTDVFCAHEYTLSNLNFALAVEPDNQDIQQQIIHCADLRQQNLPTLPSSIGVELKINPFMRCRQPAVISAAQQRSDEQLTDPASVLRVIRAWKDQF